MRRLERVNMVIGIYIARIVYTICHLCGQSLEYLFGRLFGRYCLPKAEQMFDSFLASIAIANMWWAGAGAAGKREEERGIERARERAELSVHLIE